MITPRFDRATIEALGIDPDTVPMHVAVVMDGNGRWAEQRGLKRTEGHLRGEDALFECVEAALELGVEWITVYAFSTENWKRPKAEVTFLINFNRETIRRRRDQLHDRGVRIRFAGRRNWRVPRSLLRDMEAATELTRDNDRLTFTVAFNYGGRAEIIDAVRKAMADGVDPERLDERLFGRYLYDPEMPDPDLIIRTSGEHRLSNFLLWQSAYSELLFLDILWPDFERQTFYDAVREFQHRTRRFGGV